MGHRNESLGRRGATRAETYPACARFAFGEGPLGQVLCAADSPLEIEGNRGQFTTFALEAESPALSRRGGLEAPEGQLGALRDIST